MKESTRWLTACGKVVRSESAMSKHIGKCGPCQAHYAEAIAEGRRMVVEDMLAGMVKRGELEEKDGMVRRRGKKP